MAELGIRAVLRRLCPKGRGGSIPLLDTYIESMVIHQSIKECLDDPKMVALIEQVSVERIREELLKAFAHNTLHSLTTRACRLDG